MIWFPVIKQILASYFPAEEELIVVIDRTQWRELNLLLVSLVWQQRAIPLSWQFLPPKGSSNLEQQQAVMTAVLPQLTVYSITVLGDREFCSVA